MKTVGRTSVREIENEWTGRRSELEMGDSVAVLALGALSQACGGLGAEGPGLGEHQYVPHSTRTHTSTEAERPGLTAWGPEMVHGCWWALAGVACSGWERGNASSHRQMIGSEGP